MKRQLEQLTPSLALLYTVVIWGWSFPFTKALFVYIDPVSFTAYGFLLSGIALFVVSWARGHRNFFYRWKEGVLLGVFLCLVELPQTIGLGLSSSQNTVFISNSGLLLLPFLAYFMMREKIFPRHLIALALCFLGLYYVTGGISQLGRGDLWLVFVMPMVPLYLVYSGKYEREQKNDLVLLCAQQYLVTGLIAMVWIPDFHTAFFMPPAAIANFLLVTFLATFLPYFFVQWAEEKISLVAATFIYALEPLFGGIFAWTLGGEPVTSRKIFGGFLVVVALIISQLRWHDVLHPDKKKSDGATSAKKSS